MASKIKFATYYDKESYIKDNGTLNEMESLTDQSFKFDADINELIIRYQNGLAPRTAVKPTYNMDNYETAHWTFEDWQNQKAMIERRFLHLTEDQRAFFKSPQEFFKYCSNPDNFELVKGVGVVEKEILNTPQTIPEHQKDQPPKETT